MAIVVDGIDCDDCPKTEAHNRKKTTQETRPMTTEAKELLTRIDELLPTIPDMLTDEERTYGIVNTMRALTEPTSHTAQLVLMYPELKLDAAAFLFVTAVQLVQFADSTVEEALIRGIEMLTEGKEEFEKTNNN